MAKQTRWEFIKEDNNFKLYIRQPAYQTLFCSADSFGRDKDTGENCGQKVSLALFLYDHEGNINIDCRREPNHYELIRKEDLDE